MPSLFGFITITCISEHILFSVDYNYYISVFFSKAPAVISAAAEQLSASKKSADRLICCWRCCTEELGGKSSRVVFVESFCVFRST